MKSFSLKTVFALVSLFGATGCMTPGQLQDGQLFSCQTYTVSGDNVFVYQCGADIERLACASDNSTTNLGAAGAFETYQCG